VSRNKIGDNLGIAQDRNPPTLPIIELEVKSKEEPFAEILPISDLKGGSPYASEHCANRYLDLAVHNKRIKILDLGNTISMNDLRSIRGRVLLEKGLLDQRLLSIAQRLSPVADQICVSVLGDQDAKFNRMFVSTYNWKRELAAQIGSKPLIADPLAGVSVIFKVGVNYYSAYIIHAVSRAIINPFTTLNRVRTARMVALTISGHRQSISHRFSDFMVVPENDQGLLQPVLYRAHILLTGGFEKMTPEDEAQGRPMSTIGTRLIRLGAKADHPYVVMVDPETEPNYMKHFYGPNRYRPNKRFQFQNPGWKNPDNLRVDLRPKEEED